ncbi:zinc finger CCCH domain-containing protein 5 [Cannabis sativa]|uniref:zinc finger CCCH domain-containing protein 5 n=1 Tax=Cannabis sativa TaxID=3483 RepID=UPI0029CA1950|nr:zinc finger CCCH domain-containing protein 5 [Cannabis sativa]
MGKFPGLQMDFGLGFGKGPKETMAEEVTAIAKAEGLEEEEREMQPEFEGLALENGMNRKEKRKALKKMKRKQIRKEVAMKEREEVEAWLNDPEEQKRISLMEHEEAERSARERKEFEEREKAWLEAMEMQRKKKMEEEEEEEEEQRRKALDEESRKQQVETANEVDESDEWEYEEGPAEIIWQGNEIIFKKKRVRVSKKNSHLDDSSIKEDVDRPTSNPLAPEFETFSEYRNSLMSGQQLIESVAEQVPNFGTELDKAHCPFHLKTGACRFGQRCSRVHFYPDKSCTLLIKNMYSGPGLAWEQDEGLEYTDEEVERCYEEFYEDVHTEFLKFGEIVNFKVCRNGSSHLRGNVYVHFKSLDSAVLAHHFVNGRYFAGKQVGCEFVNLTRWKVAICGEYMKSRFKTCSRGTACNFIHCFRNPGGDYEWADSDKPPPRYWVQKMVALFGHSNESVHEGLREQGNLDEPNSAGKRSRADANWYCSRRSGSRETSYRDDHGHSGSSRRKENLDFVRRTEDQFRCTSDGIRSLDDDIHEDDKHQKKRKKRHTDSDAKIFDDDRKKSGDESHDYMRETSRWKSKEYKNNTHEYGSDGERLTREGDRKKHHERARKSSNYHKRLRKLDDYEDYRSREIDFNRRGKSGNKEISHDSRKSSSRRRRYPGNHLDRNNRSHDTGRELSDKGSYGDELLGEDVARHFCQIRTQTNEVSNVSDDHGEPENSLENRGDSCIDIVKADSCNSKDKSYDSGTSSQYDERYRSHDLWESEQCSDKKSHKSRMVTSFSSSSGQYNGKQKSNDHDLELHHYQDQKENPSESEEVISEHWKSKSKSGSDHYEQCSAESGRESRSRRSRKSSHRRHSKSNRLEKRDFPEGDKKSREDLRR